MAAKVVDASVLGALVFGEPRGEEARDLLAGFDLYGPRLLAYELASIARGKALAQPAQRELLSQALEGAFAMDLRWSDVDLVSVVDLALETGLTTYDASYLHLARALRVPLVTFDRKLAAAI
jgi:predicted nucleic acid-binding protein